MPQESYPVVGVVELWDETLEVLEHTLPFFFKGATEMYAKKKKEVCGLYTYKGKSIQQVFKVAVTL